MQATFVENIEGKLSTDTRRTIVRYIACMYLPDNTVVSLNQYRY